MLLMHRLFLIRLDVQKMIFFLLACVISRAPGGGCTALRGKPCSRGKLAKTKKSGIERRYIYIPVSQSVLLYVYMVLSMKVRIQLFCVYVCVYTFIPIYI